MVLLHRSKYPRQMLSWVFVIILLVCSLSPVSATAGPASTSALPSASGAASGGEVNTWTATFVASVAARTGHTAVWTGTEMIIWGGTSSEGNENTGGRYNPTTGVWTPISTTNAPSARSGHTAVWTGAEMIVWGGSTYGAPLGSSVYFNDGGRYNPTTDTWTSIASTKAPTARSSHTVIWTGTEMLIWGGVDSSGVYLDTGGRYDPAANTWTAISTGSAPAGRWEHSAVWTGKYMIVWGGRGDAAVLNSGGRYDPEADSWLATDEITAPAPRSQHTAVWAVWSDGTGEKAAMIVWGGMGDSPFMNTLGRYDPVGNTWIVTTPTSTPAWRYGHTAVWTGSSAEMIIWGGYSGGDAYLGWRYALAADQWTPITATGNPQVYYGHTAVWTGGDAASAEMIIWGGGIGGRYNPAADTWTTFSLDDAPAARSGHTAVWTGGSAADAEMIVWGGGNGYSPPSGGRYNPAADTWRSISTDKAPVDRSEHTAVWTGGSASEAQMIVWGGYSAGQFLDTGGRYNPGSDTWRPTSTEGVPTARFGHTAVWTGGSAANAEMIIWGGSTGSGGTDTGARYDPITDKWTAMSTEKAPSARSYHTAVWTGTEMIVWGGKRGDNTGARYNPETDKWTPISTVNAPVGRYGAKSVWTGKEMLVWGGYITTRSETEPYTTIFTFFNTGGRYNPTTDTWTPISLENAPTARAYHTAVWTGVDMIIWGGSTGSISLNTGGRYDPITNTWTATRTTGAPAARQGHTAVFTGKEMIIWGGAALFAEFHTGGRYTAVTPLFMPMVTLNHN